MTEMKVTQIIELRSTTGKILQTMTASEFREAAEVRGLDTDCFLPELVYFWNDSNTQVKAKIKQMKRFRLA